MPDYFLNNSGVVGHSMITLDEGEYIVWAEPAEEGGDTITAPLTVGPGDDDAVIPPTDGGSIRAGDYLFDADVSTGGSTITFTNSSDNQFHHVALIDFGTNDPAVVEENLPAILESEDEGPAARGHRPGTGQLRVRRFRCVRAGFERHVRRDRSRRVTRTLPCASSRTVRVASPTSSSTRCTTCSRSAPADTC